MRSSIDTINFITYFLQEKIQFKNPDITVYYLEQHRLSLWLGLNKCFCRVTRPYLANTPDPKIIFKVLGNQYFQNGEKNMFERYIFTNIERKKTCRCLPRTFDMSP